MSIITKEHSMYIRTPEEVRLSLKSAKTKISDLKQCAQILYSTIINGDPNVKLVELDDELLTILGKEECLYFKGEVQQFGVLTSNNRTYELREVETSNTLLVFPTMKLSQDIADNIGHDDWIIDESRGGMLFHSYYETLRCQPKVEKLLPLLGPSSFKGPAYESQIDLENLYDWERLRRCIQASDNEIEEAFDRYSIAVIGGYYRLISFEFEAQALTLMLDVMEENSWDINQIDEKETYISLKNLIPKEIFHKIFYKYTKLSDSNKSLYTYNEEKVCKFLAQVLLAASPINEYKQFMNAWRMGVPLKMTPKHEYLNGVAITKWNSQETRMEIISFPVSNLPQDINNRLNELFKVKDKWTIEEITPYLLNSDENFDVNFLLTKYTRSSIANGVKYYSSKYNK